MASSLKYLESKLASKVDTACLDQLEEAAQAAAKVAASSAGSEFETRLDELEQAFAAFVEKVDAEDCGFQTRIVELEKMLADTAVAQGSEHATRIGQLERLIADLVALRSGEEARLCELEKAFKTKLASEDNTYETRFCELEKIFTESTEKVLAQCNEHGTRISELQHGVELIAEKGVDQTVQHEARFSELQKMISDKASMEGSNYERRICELEKSLEQKVVAQDSEHVTSVCELDKIRNSLCDLERTLTEQVAAQGSQHGTRICELEKMLSEKSSADDSGHETRISDLEKIVDEKGVAQGNEYETRICELEKLLSEKASAQSSNHETRMCELEDAITNKVVALGTEHATRIGELEKTLVELAAVEDANVATRIRELEKAVANGVEHERRLCQVEKTIAEDRDPSRRFPLLKSLEEARAWKADVSETEQKLMTHITTQGETAQEIQRSLSSQIRTLDMEMQEVRAELAAELAVISNRVQANGTCREAANGDEETHGAAQDQEACPPPAIVASMLKKLEQLITTSTVDIDRRVSQLEESVTAAKSSKAYAPPPMPPMQVKNEAVIPATSVTPRLTPIDSKKGDDSCHSVIESQGDAESSLVDVSFGPIGDGHDNVSFARAQPGEEQVGQRQKNLSGDLPTEPPAEKVEATEAGDQKEEEKGVEKPSIKWTVESDGGTGASKSTESPGVADPKRALSAANLKEVQSAIVTSLTNSTDKTPGTVSAPNSSGYPGSGSYAQQNAALSPRSSGRGVSPVRSTSSKGLVAQLALASPPGAARRYLSPVGVVTQPSRSPPASARSVAPERVTRMISAPSMPNPAAPQTLSWTQSLSGSMTARGERSTGTPVQSARGSQVSTQVRRLESSPSELIRTPSTDIGRGRQAIGSNAIRPQGKTPAQVSMTSHTLGGGYALLQ
eukprot:gnl/TRDRNA2_/TRDRNA2_156270_c0_seq1.p1 gnl/TRDRNA2_/TRDRNA2_156270_c0~~gnl/TRDRNA2_/TRDRNA2_156270_c0_seq1.p1  ORF type:complete len:1043 (-),score=250.36 gnl/TRDRNA2_/TRDRNA2_156270_c0_seq1:118-2850(-)